MIHIYELGLVLVNILALAKVHRESPLKQCIRFFVAALEEAKGLRGRQVLFFLKMVSEREEESWVLFHRAMGVILGSDILEGFLLIVCFVTGYAAKNLPVRP